MSDEHHHRESTETAAEDLEIGDDQADQVAGGDLVITKYVDKATPVLSQVVTTPPITTK